MNAGITLLIILAVPTLFQVVVIGIKQKQQYEEMARRLAALEKKLPDR